jgi:hypothetical protein
VGIIGAEKGKALATKSFKIGEVGFDIVELFPR